MVKDEVVYASVSAENTKIPEEKIKIQCSFLGFVPLKTVEIQQKELPQVLPGGNTIGIFMKTKGILVVGTGSVTDVDGMEREPSLGILKSGDYIVKADGKEISTKEEILEIVEKSQGKKIRLTVIRNGFEKECQILPVRMQDGSCKLGVWVRDDTQGLGTMTYVDGQKQYGALGHGISDVDTGLLMQIRDGKLYRASVGAVKKGEKGNPGELSGTIYYRDEQILGTITSNSETGIKGMLYAMPQELSGHSFVQTAYRQEVHTGNASIYCSIDGSVKEYTVEIEKINLSHRDINKSMVIRVKDQDLLEKTGGIVQAHERKSNPSGRKVDRSSHPCLCGRSLPWLCNFCRKYAGEVSGEVCIRFSPIYDRKAVLLSLMEGSLSKKGRKMRQELLASTKSSAYNTSSFWHICN